MLHDAVGQSMKRQKANMGIELPAIVLPAKTEELLLEPGYVTSDYLTLYVFAPLRRRDKVRRNGVDYEVVSVQEFTFKGEIAFHKASCRRLVA